MSGDILCLENKEESYVDQLEKILQVPCFRIHIEKIDDLNFFVFVKEHPHKIQKFYCGIIEGYLNGVLGEYEIYLLQIYRKNDDIYSSKEWIQYDITYYFDPFQKRFLINRDMRFEYNHISGVNYIAAFNSYDDLTKAISNIEYNEHEMKEDTLKYLLNEIPNLD